MFPPKNNNSFQPANNTNDLSRAQPTSVEPPPPTPQHILRKIITDPRSGYITFILLAIPIIYLFGWREMRFFLVPSSSMEPTLYRYDHLITLNQPHYERGDIVVLRDPVEHDGYLVKRIIAIGGDTVSVNGGAVLLNDQYLSEPYILSPPEYSMAKIEVPEDEVLLLGDNRNNSDDSHEWEKKTVPLSEIVGKVQFIYFPYERTGKVPHYHLALDSLPNPLQ